MGLRLKQLLDKQPPYIINKGNGLKISKYKVGESKKSGFPAVTAHVRDPESDCDGHDCQIVVIETPKREHPDLTTGWVKISCTCEFFKFYCEYALSKWGAANIRHSNGQPAVSTNPSNYPLMCKHCLALAKRVLK